MKRVIFPITAVLLTLPGLAHADPVYDSLQAVYEKNIVMKDSCKICTPQESPSDEAWKRTIMADMCNQQHIREAILAVQRNNQNNYWEALGKAECPDL